LSKIVNLIIDDISICFSSSSFSTDVVDGKINGIQFDFDGLENKAILDSMAMAGKTVNYELRETGQTESHGVGKLEKTDLIETPFRLLFKQGGNNE
jgi:hypothetical protein